MTQTSTSGSFSGNLEGLSPSTTYYYRAYVIVGNEKYYNGSVLSFTTSAEGTVTTGPLSCYEIPAVSLSGTGTSGTYSDRGDVWHRYNTTSSSQQIAVHTFASGSKRVRNYTTLYDGRKYAPLWVAFPLHANVYNGTYNDDASWISDPAISLTQQGGLDNASTEGYSRGHFTAASYRKVNGHAHMQTYYNSNQAPQWQNGFNSGVWSTMEQKILAASPSTSSDTLYVVVGVLYEGTTKTLPSGNLKVPIPSHFYCCVMKCSFSDGSMTDALGEAFIYTNESHTGQTYNASTFVTTIDEIEQRTGFEFFANVPSSIQEAAENGSKALAL